MNNLFLFGSFGFFEGIGRVVDIGGTMVVYNESPTTEEADMNALSSDWHAVGDDLRVAMNAYEREQTK